MITRRNLFSFIAGAAVAPVVGIAAAPLLNSTGSAAGMVGDEITAALARYDETPLRGITTSEDVANVIRRGAAEALKDAVVARYGRNREALYQVTRMIRCGPTRRCMEEQTRLQAAIMEAFDRQFPA